MPDIENTLKTLIQKDRAATFIVIVPTDSDRLKRQRELVEYHPNKAVANLRVYTLGNFLQRLYDQVHPAKLHISQGLQNLWLHEIANPQSDNPDAYRYDEFRPSQNIPVPDSTLSLIADTINRLKEYGEDPVNIGNGESQNPTKDDLVRICNDYETRLKDRWIDEQGKRLYLADNFKPIFMKDAFRQVNLVVVEGFTVLSKADLKILTNIAEKMSKIEMWFRTDCVEENKALYKNIIDLVSQFRDVNANIDPVYGRYSKLHQHYSDNLFRTEDSSVTPIAAPHIKVLKPADRSEEVEQIAHLIQKHVSKGQCKFSEICVASYNMGQYEQRIAEIFPVYDIPYSFVERLPLTKSEVVKSIFSRLSTRTDPLSDDYFSDVEPASHERLFHPSQFQEYVDNLLKTGEVIQHILNPMLEKDREVVEAEVEAYRQFNRIAKELCNVLMSEGEGSYSLGDYIEKLNHIARHTTYQSRASTKGDTVKIIAQLSELRSLEFNIVFLCDFVEGKFPEDYRPDPLLPDHPYRTEDEHLYNNRFMFYGVLKSFTELLYLLIPQREGESELIPSLFLDQLKAIADIEDKEDDEITDPAQGSVPGFLRTYGDHLWTSDMPTDGEFPDALTDMHPLIDHVVKVENSREETHKHLDYEGVLTAGTLSDESRRRLKNRQQWIYSVTELETYAKCPFQYFASRVLQLSVEEDEAEDELSSLEKGSLLHKVLFTFYKNRREQGYPAIGRCADADFEEAKRQLDAILKSASEERRGRRNEPPIGENNLFWNTDIEKLRVELLKWIEAERTHDLSVVPRYFEVNFGQLGEPADSELSSTDPIYIGDVRMKGKIDRIDIGNGAFNIIDYKTGSRTIRMPEILNGRSLQLPVYLQIAKELLEQDNGTELDAASGIYYKVRLNQFEAELGIGKKSLNALSFKQYNGKEWRKAGSSGQLLEDEIFEDRLARVSGYVQQYVDSIAKGYFPLITRVQTFPVPEEGSCVESDEYGFVDNEEHGDKPLTPRNKTEWCDYCDYKRLCRVGTIAEGTQSEE